MSIFPRWLTISWFFPSLHIRSVYGSLRWELFSKLENLHIHTVKCLYFLMVEFNPHPLFLVYRSMFVVLYRLHCFLWGIVYHDISMTKAIKTKFLLSLSVMFPTGDSELYDQRVWNQGGKQRNGRRTRVRAIKLSHSHTSHHFFYNLRNSSCCARCCDRSEGWLLSGSFGRIWTEKK